MESKQSKPCIEKVDQDGGNQSTNRRMAVRMSLRELDRKENAQKKNDFLKAWKLIKELPPTNTNSFWSIATYHGMPFKPRRVEPFHPDPGTKVWDGYCQHGNVLFPTWHRFYCLRLEQALQAVVPGGDVALHYWDETSSESLNEGAPYIVMAETVTIDGVTVPNPLRNFTLPKAIEGSAESYYVKAAGYTTVRYPFSGITYPVAAQEIAEAHNKYVDGLNETPDQLLQENIKHWLNAPPSGKLNSVYDEFSQCLSSPNYNFFSNTTSASIGHGVYQPLEQPHNDVHLIVGGYTTPMYNEDGSVKVDDEGNVVYFGLIKGANGDMGANEVAAFDPIFFLHHCNIDRMFWVWQKKWHHTNQLTIDPEDPTGGTTPKAQGPTTIQTPDQALNMQTILYPFQDEYGVPRTSTDCVNIENQLGYTYSIGSLDRDSWPTPKVQNVVFPSGHTWEKIKESLASVHGKPGVQVIAFVNTTHLAPPSREMSIFDSGGRGTVEIGGKIFEGNHHIKVQDLDKDSIPGSFVVQAFYKDSGKLYFIGQRAVLDRWERGNCANCRIHRKTAVGMAIDDVMQQHPANLEVHIISKMPDTGELKTIKLLHGKADMVQTSARFDIITSLKEVME